MPLIVTVRVTVSVATDQAAVFRVTAKSLGGVSVVSPYDAGLRVHDVISVVVASTVPRSLSVMTIVLIIPVP